MILNLNLHDMIRVFYVFWSLIMIPQLSCYLHFCDFYSHTCHSSFHPSWSVSLPQFLWSFLFYLMILFSLGLSIAGDLPSSMAIFLSQISHQSFWWFHHHQSFEFLILIMYSISFVSSISSLKTIQKQNMKTRINPWDTLCLCVLPNQFFLLFFINAQNVILSFHCFVSFFNLSCFSQLLFLIHHHH